MKNTRIQKFLLGSFFVGGLALGVTGCSRHNAGTEDTTNHDNNNDKKTMVELPKPDLYDNVALFDSLRSDIKFALAFVENYHPPRVLVWQGMGHGARTDGFV